MGVKQYSVVGGKAIESQILQMSREGGRRGRGGREGAGMELGGGGRRRGRRKGNPEDVKVGENSKNELLRENKGREKREMRGRRGGGGGRGGGEGLDGVNQDIEGKEAGLGVRGR